MKIVDRPLADISRPIQNREKRAKRKQLSLSVVDKAKLLLLVAMITGNHDGEEQLETLLTRHRRRGWPINLDTTFAKWDEQSMAALKWIDDRIKAVKLGKARLDRVTECTSRADLKLIGEIRPCQNARKAVLECKKDCVEM